VRAGCPPRLQVFLKGRRHIAFLPPCCLRPHGVHEQRDLGEGDDGGEPRVWAWVQLTEARQVLGWPKRCKLARAFLWEYS
jgi:hypothetical protein